MSLNVTTDTFNRLYAHITFIQTKNYNETKIKQNIQGADNCFLGTEEELSNVVTFGEPNIEDCFDINGNAIRLPSFEYDCHLVASVESPTKKIYFLGVYTISGMNKIIKEFKNNETLQWKTLAVNHDLHKVLWSKFIVDSQTNFIELPTPDADFQQLSAEKREIKNYGKFRAQRIEMPRKSRSCAIL